MPIIDGSGGTIYKYIYVLYIIICTQIYIGTYYVDMHKRTIQYNESVYFSVRAVVAQRFRSKVILQTTAYHKFSLGR